MSFSTTRRSIQAAAIGIMLAAAPVAAADGAGQQLVVPVIHYQSMPIDGVEVFYREAGPKDAPVVLLLHGFPTSSHMFRNLIPLLATRYHVIAPDYPGYGYSDAPDHKAFDYTFEHLANVIDELVGRLGATEYAMYVMDYGAPVGYRLALKHPERVSALVIQNGNAYEQGLKEFWDPIKAYWADPSQANRDALNGLVTRDTTKFQYSDGMSDLTRISPDTVQHDQSLLDRPGNRDIQLDLLLDYGTNVPLYPAFQKFFRDFTPPTLITWGKNDYIFPADGAAPYLRDLPNAEVHMLDTGHFALEDQLDVIAPLMLDFLDRELN
jgi:pimeloyl-ACP methyl ester carboxylesterase